MGTDSGYEYFIDPITKNKIYVHRYLMEQKLGRKLKLYEIVHHKDENKLNNIIQNLELTNRKDHASHHWKLMPEPKNRAVGERVTTSKLKEREVIKIKKRIKNGEMNNHIAKQFNISSDAIRYIRNGWSWKHVKI